MGSRKGFDPVTRPRAALLRWAGWLFNVNAGLMVLLGVRYLMHAPAPADPLTAAYMATAYLGQLALLGYLPYLLLVLPLTLLWPRPAVIRPLAVALAAATLAALLLDTLVFAQNRFHLNALIVAILGYKTWAFGALYFLIFVSVHFFVGRALWSALGRGRLRYGPALASALVACFLFAQGTHIWADARYYVPVTSFSPYLPLYEPLTAKRFLERYAIMEVADRGGADSLAAAVGGRSHRLDYPKVPMRCRKPERPLNVLMVVVDGLRADSLEPALMPNVARFATRHGTVFEQHFSGGNSSRMGLFALFYGLPSTYWDDFYGSQQPPVLITELRRAGYRFGLFGSKSFARPTGLDRTAFAGLETTPHPTHSDDWRRDQVIVQRWRDWLAAHGGGAPFFGFLFLDSLNKQVFPPEHPRMAGPADGSKLARKRADYRTSVYFLDSLVGEVLDDLERRGLMDETIVVVTSDHGQSFDDYGLGYVGYGSNFSDVQLHVPMVMHWPGRPPGRIERRSAHRDVAPTLLQRMLGCANPPAEYSTGTDLFDGPAWDWLIAGSYSEYAVVEPKRVTVIKPGGYYEVRGEDYHLLRDARLDRSLIQRALDAMSRFYR